jgi:hypothetical protein
MKKTQRNEEQNFGMTAFMSLLVILIPVLLTSVEFSKISVHDFTQYTEGTNPDTATTTCHEHENKNLYIMVTDSILTVATKSTFLQSFPFSTRILQQTGGYPEYAYITPETGAESVMTRLQSYLAERIPVLNGTVTIASSDSIQFDLLIQVMDVVKLSGYSNIAISRIL